MTHHEIKSNRNNSDNTQKITTINKGSLDYFSNDSHAFDTGLAAHYGIEEAIIISHFIHWINVNKRLGHNFIDGRTWTYQSREEIAAHFEYFDERKVRYIVENLVKKGVLIARKLDPDPFIKTLWYAFNDESMFIKAKNPQNSKKFYERQNCQIGRSKLTNEYKGSHTKPTYTKKEIYKENPPTPKGESNSPSKNEHGKYVRLSHEEKARLEDKWGNEMVADKIVAMNAYCEESRPKGYKNYFTMLESWCSKESLNPTHKKKRLEDKNREIARDFLSRNPSLRKTVEIFGQYVRVNDLGSSFDACINFSELGFKNQFENALRKFEIEFN